MNFNISEQKKKNTNGFKNHSIMEGIEVTYTWEMDFNSSLLGAAALTVPKAPTPSPTSSLMPLWAHNSGVCLFAAMLTAVAFGGNAIVICIVTGHRRMRTVTNYFLVNLSFADLMMASLNCLFNFIYMLHKYQAIVRPIRPRMSKTCYLIMIAGIWVSGMLLAISCLLYFTTKEYKSKGIIKTACLLSWPDGLPDVSYMDFVYQVLFFVVTYAVPMLGMTFFYSSMGRVLWGSRSIGELTQRQADSIRSKRKVVKMFILMIVIFGLCWLPYHTYFIYTHFNPSILYMKYIQHVYLGFYWLAMANAMVNPVIYYWILLSLDHIFVQQYFAGGVTVAVAARGRCLSHRQTSSPRRAADPDQVSSNTKVEEEMQQSHGRDRRLGNTARGRRDRLRLLVVQDVRIEPSMLTSTAAKLKQTQYDSVLVRLYQNKLFNINNIK